MSKRKSSLIIILLLVLTVSSCKSVQLKSRWIGNTNVEIDGEDNEWQNDRYYFVKEDVALDIMNDDEYLYLCFASPVNKIPEKMLMQGFTIWFDTKGKNKHKTGLRFVGESPIIDKENKFMKAQMHQGRRRIDVEMLKKKIHNIESKIEILTSKKESNIYPINQVIGTEAKMNIKSRQFTFELKIPFIQNDVYTWSIGTEQGSEVSVKLEIQKTNAHPPKGGSDGRLGGPFSEGGPPGGGKGLRRGGKKGGVNGAESPKIQFTVKLAEK